MEHISSVGGRAVVRQKLVILQKFTEEALRNT